MHIRFTYRNFYMSPGTVGSRSCDLCKAHFLKNGAFKDKVYNRRPYRKSHVTLFNDGRSHATELKTYPDSYRGFNWRLSWCRMWSITEERFRKRLNNCVKITWKWGCRLKRWRYVVQSVMSLDIENARKCHVTCREIRTSESVQDVISGL
jgi:hypothetical protein